MTESTMVGDIIDAHTHVDEVPALGWIDPPEKLVKLLDEVGIARAVVMTYTELPGFNPHALEYLADVVARFPDRSSGSSGSTRGTPRRRTCCGGRSRNTG